MYSILYTKLTVNLKFIQDGILPKIKTSALRGGIGNMLLINNCVNDRKCDLCSLKYICNFKNLFNRELIKNKKNTEKVSPSFTINCDNYNIRINKGEIVSFEIKVFQDSIALLPILFDAIESLGKFGLGSKSSEFFIEGIYNENGELIYRDGNRNNSKIIINTLDNYVKSKKKQYVNILGIELITPFRVKKSGKFAKQVDERTLIMAVLRRIVTLKSFTESNIEINETDFYLNITKSTLFWEDEFERYSSRQDSYMTFGGLKGKILLSNINYQTQELLIAGELLNIGKNTAFGLGKYKIIWN